MFRSSQTQITNTVFLKNKQRVIFARWLMRALILGAVAGSSFAFCQAAIFSQRARVGRTVVSIKDDAFYLNGRRTYENRTWQGYKIQGLLMNGRMVQGIFDDHNPETRQRWKYPDTGTWDPERNTNEFIAAMPAWRQKGLLNFTINLQGGSPEGYSKEQPWENNAFAPDGALKPAYLNRLKRILDKADALGMTVMVGFYYFGQDERLQDEAAVIRGVDNATNWLLKQGYRHVMVEINNECNHNTYNHAILRPERVPELIKRVKQKTRQGRRLLVSTSFTGGALPTDAVIQNSDFVLLHGNGVSDPARITDLVRQVRQRPVYSPKPILYNEDDHFNFDQPQNNCRAAISEYCSWGYFDPGKNNYQDGYQSMPVDWHINTPLKTAFFNYVAEITGTR
ncbi:hypothetical protein [Adhaeribacter rhizoryzae]|uniref:hypothetical protein n=1 Tax=Adhaeribacter rhizoryzae TaxID=2607907 RepID=UPI001CC21A35|nr:hypothetical protein [Adhaeribacter rhizoryzae]